MLVGVTNLAEAALASAHLAVLGARVTGLDLF